MEKSSKSTICMKCDQVEGIIQKKELLYCRDCYEDWMYHKFRMTLTSSRLKFEKGKILLAISGGKASQFLTHVLKYVVDPSLTRRVFFDVHAIYVDTSSVMKILDIKQEKQESDAKKVIEGAHSVWPELDVCQVSIEDVLVECKENKIDALQQIFEHASPSSKVFLLKTLLHRTLSLHAVQNGYSAVVVGDLANNVASNTVTAICEGRGPAVPFESNLVDNRWGTPFVRLLLDLEDLDVKTYLEMNDIHWADEDHAKNDIVTAQDMIRGWVDELQSTNFSTVNTVVATGKKLCASEAYGTFLSNKDFDSDLPICHLCHGSSLVACLRRSTGLGISTAHIHSPFFRSLYKRFLGVGERTVEMTSNFAFSLQDNGLLDVVSPEVFENALKKKRNVKGLSTLLYQDDLNISANVENS